MNQPGSALARRLNRLWGSLDTPELIETVLKRLYPDRIAVTSAFGAESAVILSLVAECDPDTPVIFLDTEWHFPETLDYRDRLIEILGLGNVNTQEPDPVARQSLDPQGNLHEADHDACCRLRKVEPLARALYGFDAWIMGRKAFHGGARSGLGVFEWADGRVKVNPLANWTPDDIKAAMEKRGLPPHPLAAKGYTSIGCFPCTRRPVACGDLRSGRWAGTGKTECGIHAAL